MALVKSPHTCVFESKPEPVVDGPLVSGYRVYGFLGNECFFPAEDGWSAKDYAQMKRLADERSVTSKPEKVKTKKKRLGKFLATK